MSAGTLHEHLNRLILNKSRTNEKSEKELMKRKDNNLLKKVTLFLLDSILKCNSRFNYMPNQMNPRRNLTHPAEPVNNNGYDNRDFDYILKVGDFISSPESKE